MIAATDLAALNPLQKVHLSWPFQTSAAGSSVWNNSDLLTQYVRITGSVPLLLDAYSSDQLAAIQANGWQACVTIRPFLTIAANKQAASYCGPDFLTDLTSLGLRLQGLAAIAPQVKWAVIDIECWYPPRDQPTDMLTKYAIVHQMVEHFLPAAQPIYYNRGAIEPNGGSDTGWAAVPWYPAGSPGQINSCSLYLSEWAANQLIYMKTQAAALASNSASTAHAVVPFLALGGAQERQGSGWGPFRPGGYPAETTWQIGLEINNPNSAKFPERFPVSAAPLVFFWPAAFDPRFPDWPAQFVAYCRGASNQPLD